MKSSTVIKLNLRHCGRLNARFGGGLLVLLSSTFSLFLPPLIHFETFPLWNFINSRASVEGGELLMTLKSAKASGKIESLYNTEKLF